MAEVRSGDRGNAIAGHRRSRRPYRPAAVLDDLVISLLKKSNRPLTAYELADRSSEQGTVINPAQIYRVLERLIIAKRVQRIELLSAYMLRQGEVPGFMVCRCCRSVQSFPLGAMLQAAERICRSRTFRLSRTIVESWGICAECNAASEVPGRATIRKEQGMANIKSKLSVLMMAAGAMIMADVPAEASERPPGVLYDRSGNTLGAVQITDAPGGVISRAEARGLPPGWHGMHFHERAVSRTTSRRDRCLHRCCLVFL